jgi:signal transduction histidine kinase
VSETDGPGTPRIDPRVFDAILTATLFGVGLLSLTGYLYGWDGAPGAVDAAGVVLVAAAALPLLARRRAPLAAGLAVGIVAVATLPWDSVTPTVSAAMLIAVYSAGAYAELGRSVAVLGVMTVATVAYVVVYADRDPYTAGYDAGFTILGLVGVWGLGRTLRTRRLYTAELEDRTARLERTRAAEVQVALADQRSQIARELHDVVAHHVSVMTVQAAGARRALDRQPERAKDALMSIESTGRAALSEMRRIVGVLRGPDVETAVDPGAVTDTVRTGAILSPQPGLRELSVLAEQVQAAGVPVRVVVTGDEVDLPAGVDLTAFRIVQEALTNTLKHAGPSSAEVRVDYSPREVAIRVCDDGRGLAAALEDHRPGHGLVGMRERVSLYGGTVTVGPRSGGGFEVRARIPFDTAAV